jgi:hypothetical protein
MGLIRSAYTNLTPMSEDEELTAYLWPIVREMIKTAIENQQNLIVEGCYIPFDWEKDFEKEYLLHIQYCCLVMSERYIRSHFDDIRSYASVIEQRLDDDCTLASVLADNKQILDQVQRNGLYHVLIDEDYEGCIDGAVSFFSQKNESAF